MMRHGSPLGARQRHLHATGAGTRGPITAGALVQVCESGVMNIRASIFGPAATTAQAIVGATISFALALLIGFGLNQGADSAVFTAALIGVAVLMIGLKRARAAQRVTTKL